MSNNYDVIIIGAGPSGIFCAYELKEKRPDLKVLMIEKGRSIEKRQCPKRKTKVCVGCQPCSITTGFAGAGAFSDGKLSLSPDVGGNLPEILGYEEALSLIKESDDIYLKFGADTNVYGVDKEKEIREIRRKAINANLKLIECPIRHLGTEEGYKIYARLQKHLLDLGVEILFNTMVADILVEDNAVTGVVTEKGDIARCQYLIAAPGRSGAEWFANQCKNLGIKLINNQVDIGVRVELPARVFEHITDVVYESKLVYRTKQYGDSVRTFCMNPYGHVVAENVEGINTVNGHSYSDASLRSENTNFALLVSNRFTEPFDEPYRYGKHIASLSNMLAGGVLVQRFGDLVKGVRTNEHRLSQSFVKPTLTAAIPGDLSLALPKRQLDDIIEMIYALDKVAPGTANYDTLLYGAEVKFYSSRLELSHELETKLPGFFAIGDGAGTTRGLAQAGASGIKAARAVLSRIK